MSVFSHLHEDIRRLAATECPFAVDNCEGDARDAFLASLIAELVDFSFEFVRLQELDSL